MSKLRTDCRVELEIDIYNKNDKHNTRNTNKFNIIQQVIESSQRSMVITIIHQTD